jgi:hypothetical protein
VPNHVITFHPVEFSVVTSVPPSPLENAFAPAYLARLREQEDVLTAAEAELAGPWKIEPVPGKPGAVAILRQWEDLGAGDPPGRAASRPPPGLPPAPTRPHPRVVGREIEASVEMPAVIAGLPATIARLPAMIAGLPATTARLLAMIAGLPATTARLLAMTVTCPAVIARLPAMTATLPVSTVTFPGSDRRTTGDDRHPAREHRHPTRQ